MVQPSLNRPLTTSDPAWQEFFLRAYRFMLLARVLDDKYASLYRGGKIYGGCFLGRGQEAYSVAAGLHLQPGDVFAPLVRDAAGRLAFGETPLDAVRSYLGSPLGPMRARDGNVHRGRLEAGMLPMISHLGAMISVVNGMLLARRLKGVLGTVGVASLGDGGTSTGAFHEAMNQAGVERLPLVYFHGITEGQYLATWPVFIVGDDPAELAFTVAVAEPAALLAGRRTRFICRKKTFSGITIALAREDFSWSGSAPEGR